MILSFNVFAGSYGYIFQGKTTYLFKDGKKIENQVDVSQISRGPASLSPAMTLFFTEDEYVRCYYWSPKFDKKPSKNIHCIKLSELK